MKDQPAGDPFLTNVALALWASRDTAEPTFIEEGDEPQKIEITLSNGISIVMRASFNGWPGNLRMTIKRGSDVVTKEGHTIVHRAWEAVQAHVMVKALGYMRKVEDPAPAFFYPPKPTLTDKLMRRRMPRDTLSVTRSGLMWRIEQEMAKMTMHPGEGMLDIGNGVKVIAIYYPARFEEQHEAWAYIASHGNLNMSMFYGNMEEAFKSLKTRAIARMSRIDATIAPPVSISDGSKEAEILRIGHEALAANGDLHDRMGVPIAPLIERHLPSLVHKHREAMSEMVSERDQALMEREFDNGLDIIAAVLEEGLSMEKGDKREDLMTHLRFLRDRHPHIRV